MLANKLSEASISIEKAIHLVPKATDRHIEMLIDRARISAADDDYEMALKDLELVLVEEPNRVDVLLLGASAARILGLHMVAMDKLKLVLVMQPDDPQTLIERGHLHREMGNDQLARLDWLKVIRDHPETLIGEEARSALEAMEIDAIEQKD